MQEHKCSKISAAGTQTMILVRMLRQGNHQADTTVGLSAATQGSGWLQSKAERADNPFGSAEYSICCPRLLRDYRSARLSAGSA